jgi:Ran GTPase-activating protein (RanGAP) involved in mRNA processing and transport
MRQMEDGFTDEAGVALADALTSNKTLHELKLNDNLFARNAVDTKASLGAQAYKAFGAMLRVNTCIKLDLPVLDADVVDQRLVDSRNQMLIEQRLNAISRGKLLASSQTPK